MPRTAKRLKALGLPGWLAAANPVIIGLGRLGVVPGPVRVLTVPGRTTGEPRTTPVTPVVWRDGGTSSRQPRERIGHATHEPSGTAN